MAPQSKSSEMRFEPCASTASLFLFAQGSTIVCLHHDTLAMDRRFHYHQDDVYFISVDNVSERGAGRLVVSYDVGQTAIVWDLFTGTEIARFASFEHLQVAAWMRNGNVVFGNGKGDVILFEPSTSEHISARTIFDPITALAPASDCRTYAIGYQNGSILIANLHPTFTILHTLSTSRGPSPIVALAWHASSSKQKSDMLATQASDGDLRVLSVAKPPGKESPRVIRVLKRSDSATSELKWIAWSKNGRIVQYLDGETWAWDVRTKHVTYEPIPTIEHVRAIANYGPTATLFTLGPQHTVQQYDLEVPAMVAQVQHLPVSMPSGEARVRTMTPPNLQALPDITEQSRRSPFSTRGAARKQPADIGSPVSVRSHTNSVSSKASSDKYRSTPFPPPDRSTQSGTTFSLSSVAGRETPQPSGTSLAYASCVSVSSMKSSRIGSRLRNELRLDQADKQPLDLFPSTRARLNDVPFKQHRPPDENRLTPDDLRRHMLSVVFGWDLDIEALIKDELSRHPIGSESAVLLSRWLGESDTNQMVSMMNQGPASVSDWMLLALSQMNGQEQANKVGQAFVQKLLETGDIHTSATILLALGDRNDAIEVYVSRSHFMEAILMTCLLMPREWQRQSYLVRKWGEHVVSHSQQQLAIRCFMCTGVEPSEPWTSPTAQQVTSFQELLLKRSPVASPEPAYANMSMMPPPATTQFRPSRPTAKTPALKLITSFEPHSNQNFKFPGLKSDDRTPTVMPGVTPIAESAAGESALSPGGFGSYRLNNAESINQARPGRTGTPALTRSRLPSIGETPVDVQPPSFPPSSAVSSRSEYLSAKRNGHNVIPNDKHRRSESQNSKSEDLVTLLPSVRYDPDREAHRASPQTAVQTNPDKFKAIKGLPSPTAGVFEILKEHSLSQNGSRDRKPDGLHINLPLSGSSRSSTHGTASPVLEHSDLFADTIASSSTFNSEKYTNAASVSDRSIEQYINSLDEVNFQAQKQPDGKLHGQDRGQLDDLNAYGSRPHRSRKPSLDSRGRHEHRYIQPAKRSPSSPVPMSPEELARMNASAENLEASSYKAKSQSSKKRSGSKMRKGNSRARTPGEQQRHRSSSRNTANRVRDKSEHSTRGRHISRDGSRVRSPCSPLPMSPVGREIGQHGHDMDGALRLVASDRERLRSRQRSTSRRPAKGDGVRERSPDARRPRARSRSRHAGDRDAKTEIEENVKNGQPTGEDGVISEKPKAASDGDAECLLNQPNGPSSMVSAEQERKVLAAAELEARRLSLARNPSAPSIPFPGDLHHSKSPIEGRSNLFSLLGQRTQARQKIPPPKSSPDYPNSSDSNSSRSGVHVGLPATPRAMRHPKYSNEHEENNAPAVPNLSGSPLFSNNVQHAADAERIGRSMSVPVSNHQKTVPADLPHHPRFIPTLPRSRSTSRTRHVGHSRTGSREMANLNGLPSNSSPPVSVSIEEAMKGTVQKQPTENPPILPELQHLNSPPPPPPAPVSSTNGMTPRNSTGTIDIAFENEHAGKTIARAMTAAPAVTTDKTASIERHRVSFDHRRGRSINESLSSKIRNLTGRMRSTSRGPATQSREVELPYESVPMMESRI